MYTTLELVIMLASGLRATTYGFGEMMCGSHPPRPCVRGEQTASGEEFAPFSVPSAAVAAPRRMPMKAGWIYLKLADGPFRCARIRLNDKSHPRWMGERGFDLSPAAVQVLTRRAPRADWSARVEVCS
jgi:hypothetical protein